jgi:S1-C subfamily serine protease
MQMQDYSGYGGYGQPPSGDYGHTAPLPPLPPPPPPRRRVGLLSYLAVALVAGALGAGSVVALYHPASNSTAAPSAQPSAPVPLPSSAVPIPGNGGTGTSGGSLSKVEQGVVIINTALQYSSERAAGTGMVINAGSGLVLTNNHVIENSTKITATVAATGQKFQAKVVGYDVTGDIALIQLQHPSGLHQVPLGDSGKVKVGDAVTALGNADGQNQIVPAPGHITGVNRTITASDQGGAVRSETLHGMLQTDAGIVSGDSGGPLVNAAGQVIGMDTAGNDVRSDQQQTAGFAIPINTALSVAREIAAGHASSTISIGYPPFIGIYVGQGTSSDPQQQAAAQQQQNSGFGGFGGFGGNGSGGNGSGSQRCYSNDSNLPVPSTIAPVSSGTLVIGTICNSPAADAGVTAGSVITSVNGQAVGAPESLHTQIAKYRPGNTVSVTWVNPSGQHKTASVTLTAGPPL